MRAFLFKKIFSVLTEQITPAVPYMVRKEG